jgi:hypothetical protein
MDALLKELAVMPATPGDAINSFVSVMQVVTSSKRRCVSVRRRKKKRAIRGERMAQGGSAVGVGEGVWGSEASQPFSRPWCGAA